MILVGQRENKSRCTEKDYIPRRRRTASRHRWAGQKNSELLGWPRLRMRIPRAAAGVTHKRCIAIIGTRIYTRELIIWLYSYISSRVYIRVPIIHVRSLAPAR